MAPLFVCPMPARSRKQWRWMYATHQPFARRWAHMAPYASLPASKDGEMLHGHGGLMATPGMGGRKRKWGMKRKAYTARAGEQIAGNLYRGAGGQFSSGPGGGGAPSVAVPSRLSRQPKPTKRKPAALPKPKRGGGKRSARGGKGGRAAQPKQTPEQKRGQKRQERAAEQTQNRNAVKQAMADADQGLSPSGFDALTGLAAGKEPDAQTADGLIQMGMAKRGSDGVLRLTSDARGALTAADRGDAKAAIDAVSRGQDRAKLEQQRGQARQTRQQEAAQRRQERTQRSAERAAQLAERRKKQEAARGKKPSGISEGKQPETPKPTIAERRAQTAAQTAGQLGITSATVDNLRNAAEGRALNDDGTSHELERLGLIQDGETTDQGRRALSALEHGNVRQYQAALQDARSRMAREQRQQKPGHEAPVPSGSRAQIIYPKQRRQKAMETYKAGSPGDYLVVEDPQKPDTWHLQVKRNGKPDHGLMGGAWAALHSGYRGNVYQGPNKQEAIGKLKRLYAAEKMPLPTEKAYRPALTVYKDASGAYRWITRTTTAYKDRDGEIIAEQALEADAQRMTATKQYGPLRWWHVGSPNPLDTSAPWGTGVDLGTCDYSTVIGRTSIESGRFHDPVIAEKIASSASDYEVSPGFLHPPDQPDADGVYWKIQRFERSLVPTRHGRASNLFTGLTVKESRMDANEMERRFKALITDLKLSPEQAQGLAENLVATEKAAEAQGIAYKSDDADDRPPPELTINGVTYVLKAEETDDDPVIETKDDGMGDMETMAADGVMPAEAPSDGGGDYIGDMSPDEFRALLTEVLTELLAPALKMQDMVKAMGDMHGELKGMLGGVATKDAGAIAEVKAEVEALQATLKAAQDRLATLEGDQPSAALALEAEAALKSGGPQSPPDPKAPQVPTTPDRPWAGLAALIAPELYTPNGNGNS